MKPTIWEWLWLILFWPVTLIGLAAFFIWWRVVVETRNHRRA